MTRQIRFEIRPNGHQIELLLRGTGFPQNGAGYPRVLPALNAADIDAFRTGTIPFPTFQALGDTVSRWFLDPELRPLTGTWLSGTDLLQLVFAVDQELDSKLGDLPFELLEINGVPLAMHEKVRSVVHLLPKVGTKADSSQILSFPMRVLIVRSNPRDAGGRVPPGSPLRDAILDIARERFGAAERVKVDLLSSEAGAQVSGPPTFKKFRDKLEQDEYDVLVYLGHGDVQDVVPGAPPASLLQFESDDPRVHEPVVSRQLANVLHRQPIPVVLLAGCMTAAVPGDGDLTELPTWMRGNQGMAQALVNSESGVSVAVGMRANVDSTDATSFLKKFFRSLLIGAHGNVEAAVSEGRRELYVGSAYSSSWAAPVAFSSLEPEPLLGYLAQKDPGIVPTNEMNVNLEGRRLLWTFLANQPPPRAPYLATAVQENRAALLAAVRKEGAALYPELSDQIQPGTQLEVPVILDGPMTLSKLRFKISCPSGINVTGFKASAGLLGAGFSLWVNTSIPETGLITAPVVATMPNGIIFTLELKVAADARGAYGISIEIFDTDCMNAHWPGSNAVIVVP